MNQGRVSNRGKFEILTILMYVMFVCEYGKKRQKKSSGSCVNLVVHGIMQVVLDTHQLPQRHHQTKFTLVSLAHNLHVKLQFYNYTCYQYYIITDYSYYVHSYNLFIKFFCIFNCYVAKLLQFALLIPCC